MMLQALIQMILKVLDMQKNDPRKSPINNEYLNHKSKIFQM